MNQFKSPTLQQIPTIRTLQQEVESSIHLPFQARLESNKWQIRRKLYQNILQILKNNQPLADLDPSIENADSFCIYIPQFINQPHMNNLNQSLKVVQMFTKKQKISINGINKFICHLIQKTGGNMVNVKPFQRIIQNCMQSSQKAIYVMKEMQKYCNINKPKIVLFCMNGIKFLLDNYELKNVNDIIQIFNKHRQLLEGTTNKEIRDIVLMNMVQILKYIEQPFEQLVKNQLKNIRPIVIKQLRNLIDVKKDKKISDQKIIINKKQEKQIAIDLTNIFPINFFQIKFIHQNQKKVKLLTQIENKLQKIQPTTLIKKDYTNIFILLQIPLEQQNFLVVNSALKVLRQLLRLCYKNIPLMSFKRLLSLTADKYKGTKSKNFNIQIHEVINLFVLNKSIGLQNIIEIIFEIIQKGKNLNSRLGLLEWLSTQFQKMCLKVYQKDYSIFENVSKMKKIVLIIKKKLENIKIQANSKIRQEVISLNLVLNNLQTSQNIIQNQSKFYKTVNNIKNQEVKIQQKKNKFNSTLFQPQVIPKDSIQQRPIHNQSNNNYSINQSNIQSNQTFLNINKTQLNSLNQTTFANKIDKHLLNLRKFALVNSESAVAKQIEQCWKVIQNQSSENYIDFLNSMVTFVDEVNCADLKKTTVTYKPYMKQKLFQFVLKIISKVNRQITQIDDQTLILQLYLLFNKVDIRIPKKIQNFLDSLYMSCQLQSFLRVSPQILKNNDGNPVVRNTYSGWLSYKLDHSQNFNLNIQFLGYIQKLLSGIDEKIANSLRRKIQMLSGKIQVIKNNYATPQKQSKKKRVQGSREKSSEKIRINTELSNLVLLNTHQLKLPRQIQLLIEVIEQDIQKGVYYCKQFLQNILPQYNNNKQTKYSNQEIQSIIKALSTNTTQSNALQISTLFKYFKSTFPQYTQMILKIYLQTFATKQSIPSSTSISQQNWFQNFLQGLPINTIITNYQKIFDQIVQKQQAINFITNLLKYIISKLNFRQLKVNVCISLAQSLCFCLTDKRITHLGQQILQKFHNSLDNCHNIILGKVKGQLFIKAYKAWLKNFNDDIQINTIEQLTHIQPGQVSTSKTLQGLQNFIANTNTNKKQQQFQSLTDRPNKQIKFQRKDRSEKKKVQFNLQDAEFKPQHSSDKKQLNNQQIVQRSMQQSIIQKFIKQDQYLIEQKKLQKLLGTIKINKTKDCVKQLQQLFLTNQNNPHQVIEQLWQTFVSLKQNDKKNQFIFDLKNSIYNKNFLLSLSEINYLSVLTLILKLCANYPKQQFQSIGSKTLQSILNILLTYKNPNVVAISCIKILNDQLPSDFSKELDFQARLMIRLLSNCLQKLISMCEQGMRAFEILLEIYKFFKTHKPQELVQGLPSVKDIEYVFKVLKNISDVVINREPERSRQFYDFIKRNQNRSIYLDYVGCALQNI